jgi:hypothetical protein
MRRKPGWPLGGLFAFADLDRCGPGLLKVAQAQAVARALAQVVEVAVGQRCQPLELSLAVDLELSLENMPRGRAAEPLVRLIDCSQQLDVRRGIVALVARPPGGLGGSRSGVSWMDSCICQTSAASPAEPGGLPWLARLISSEGVLNV